MSCSDFDVLLMRRAARTLSDVEGLALEAHLATCDDCREQAELIGDGPVESPATVELARVDAAVFEHQRKLGEGGMGITILVRDRRLDRLVALKRPRSQDSPAMQRDLLARFEREARLTSKLQHPAIVSIYEAGYLLEDGGEQLYYTMQPVFGEQLQVELEHRPSIEQRLELLPHITTIANAVAYAHEQGIVHRDIKPANILVGQFGEAVLIDWGLAKQIHETDAAVPDEIADGTLTRIGAGTVNYMPPEQALGAAAEPRFDVYALGATLYHLLAGAPPYGESEVRSQLNLGPPPELAEVAPGAPTELVSIVAKAMARDPAQRFATARELAAELVRFQAGQLVQSHHHTTLDLVRRWLRRHRAAVTAATIALIATVVIGAFSISRVLSERTQALDAQAAAEISASDATKALRRMTFAQTAEELSVSRPLSAAARVAHLWTHGDRRSATRITLAWALSRAGRAPRTIHLGTYALVNVKRLGRGNLIAVATRDQVVILDARGTAITQRNFDEPRIAVDETRDRIAVAANDGAAMILTGLLADSVRLEHVIGPDTGPDGKLVAPNFTSVALSPDGTLAVAGDEHGYVTVWSLATGKRLRTLRAGNGSVLALAYGQGGELAIANYDESTIGIWSADGSRRLSSLLGADGPDGIHASHDATRWVAASSVGVFVWDAAIEREQFHVDLDDHAADTGSLDAGFSDDDATVFDLRGEHVYVWDARDGSLLDVFDGQAAGGNEIATTEDGTIATGADRGVLTIWPPTVRIDAVPVKTPVSFTDIATQGRTVATLSGNTVDLVDLERHRVVDRIEVADTQLMGASEDGCTLGIVSREALSLYSVCGGTVIPTRRCEIGGPVGKPMRIVIDSGRATIYGSTGWIAPCDERPAHRWCTGCSLRRLTAQFGSRVAILDGPRGAIVDDLTRGKEFPCGGVCAKARWFSVMPGAERLLVLDNEALSILTIATSSLRQIAAFPASRKVSSVATYHDGSVAAVSDGAGFVTLFDLDDGLQLFTTRVSVQNLRNVEFVGDSLVTVAEDGRVRRMTFDAIPDDTTLSSDIASMIARRKAQNETDDLPLDTEAPLQNAAFWSRWNR